MDNLTRVTLGNDWLNDPVDANLVAFRILAPDISDVEVIQIGFRPRSDGYIFPIKRRDVFEVQRGDMSAVRIDGIHCRLTVSGFVIYLPHKRGDADT